MVRFKKADKSLISLLKILPTKLIITTFLFVAFFSIFLAQNHNIFNTYAWDLGIFDQVLWSTLHGRPFYYTLEPFWSQYNNFLATHFSPILVLVLPFYALYPKPETLFVVHSAIIALGVIVVYKLSYLVLKNEKYALIFSMLYLLNPLVLGQAFSSFHLEGFFMTSMMFTVYFFIKRNWWKYFFCFALTLMTIEYAAIPLIFFGITMLLMINKWGSPSWGVKFLIPFVTIVSSLLYFVLAQNTQLALGLIKVNIHQEWKILGANSIVEVPLKIIENPVAALNALSYDSLYKILYLLMIFAPVLFLPLLEPIYLLPISPWLIIALFSNYPAYYVVFTYYPAFIVPFIFLATIYGFRKITKSKNVKIANLKRLVSPAMLMTTMLFLFISVPSIEPMSRLSRVDFQHVTKLHEILGLLPNNASILAQDNIFPHVSGRFEAYTIPSPNWEGFASKATEMLNITLAKKPEYVLIDLGTDNPYSRAMGELILETLSKSEELSYGIFAERDGIYLFKFNYTGLPLISSKYITP
ncbi:MAG: DUF2079 domain-containing protein [archaeon]|nr:DUF2079 domain-containing protein [archaeon]MCP8313924.1 DUF2079 domain-containing protein [archaeon]